MKLVTVQEIMIPKENIITISSLESVRNCLQIMQERKVKSIVVEKDNPHDAFGIVTYTNILNAIFAQDGDMDLLNVYDIATKPIIQVSADLNIKYAAQMMINNNVNRLIVTGNGDLLGLLSMNDIVAVLMNFAQET
jgi:signal-transduction protein with cAMP-binding, CBS, and nucleotidyltransferase domain